MLKVKQFIFNMFSVNTFVIYDTDTLSAIVVDPGMRTLAEYDEFDNFISNNHISLTQIVNTHLHLDHCFGDNNVRDRYGVKVAANDGDKSLGMEIGLQMSRFGIKSESKPVEIDIKLHDGDIIKIGSNELIVIETPGHSRGGICLYSASDNFLIAGDTLFRHAIGRTDLEGGDYRQLINSIINRLFVLPENTIVMPGHDRMTTIGEEKRNNPYL